MKVIITPTKTELILLGVSPDAKMSKNFIKNNYKTIGHIKDLTNDDCAKWLIPDKINGLYLLYNSEHTTDMWVNNDGNLNSLVRTEFVLPKESFLSFLIASKIIYTSTTIIIEKQK